MRIMFNCRTLKKGGAERVIAVLANKLSQNNDVYITTLLDDNIEYSLNSNIKICSLCNDVKRNFINKISLIELFKIKNIIDDIEPDIIISFLPEPSFKLMAAKKVFSSLKKYPVIISIRNDPNIEYKNILIKFVMSMLYKKVDGMVYQTQEAKEYFRKIIKTKNQMIIPNPINENFIIDKIDFSNKEDKIVNVGRLFEQKNQMLLIDSFKIVCQKYPNYKLYIYGDGPLKNELMRKIKELDLSKNVFLMGKVDDVKANIVNSKIYILSSNYEGMPNSLMEAMALGLACISSDCPCGGPKFLIDNYNNGLLFETNNKDELATKMIELIENEDLMKRLSENAKDSTKNFSIDKISLEWEKIINMCRGEKNENNKK